jgi:hypothetical protein
MMAKKSKSAPQPSKPAVILKSISAVKQPSASASKAPAAKVPAKTAAPVAAAAPAKQTPAAKAAPAKQEPVKAAPVKAALSVKETPASKPATQAHAQAGLVDPSALIETLTTRRQESLNNAIAQLHALHSQMLHAAGRHANTALQFLNNAPKTGTLTDMIEWQSRWFLSHAHVHQDGVKALGTLASQNIEHLQKSLRVDLPLKAS